MNIYQVVDPYGTTHVAFVDWDAAMKTFCGLAVCGLAVCGFAGVLIASKAWRSPEKHGPTTCLWCLAVRWACR